VAEAAHDTSADAGGDIQHRLSVALRESAEKLAASGLPHDLVAQMEQLAEEVRQPCTVAVVGRVNSGKSSFINALLGQDLAKVGATETTATINYFRYGDANPDRPVTCYWRNGQVTAETKAFLDQLQGNDSETLRRADGIDRLEYHVLTPILERINLIDTPGTGGVVDEHGQRTAEVMGIEREVPRYDQDTRRLERSADAVIYMVGAPDASTDRELRAQFLETAGTQSTALNSIGVLSKVDLDEDLIAHPVKLQERTDRIGGQLRDNLNVVVPVSAGVRRAMDRLLADGHAGLTRLIAMLRATPQIELDKALDDYDAYIDPQLDCPVPTEERRELLAMAGQWMVFTTIARVLLDTGIEQGDGAKTAKTASEGQTSSSVAATEAALRALSSLAGFEKLRDVLERHFIRRAHYLRGYRVLGDALKVVNTVKYRYAPDFRMRRREQEARTERLLTFIRQAHGNPATARELEELVQTGSASCVDLEPVVDDLERSLGAIFAELEEYSADMTALLQLEDHDELFDETELQELRPLLGLYGMEIDRRLPAGKLSIDYAKQRQGYWLERQYDRRQVRQVVAVRAVARYGFILNELDKQAEV
jgi:hypothetical protein